MELGGFPTPVPAFLCLDVSWIEIFLLLNTSPPPLFRRPRTSETGPFASRPLQRSGGGVDSLGSGRHHEGPVHRWPREGQAGFLKDFGGGGRRAFLALSQASSLSRSLGWDRRRRSRDPRAWVAGLEVSSRVWREVFPLRVYRAAPTLDRRQTVILNNAYSVWPLRDPHCSDPRASPSALEGTLSWEMGVFGRATRVGSFVAKTCVFYCPFPPSSSSFLSSHLSPPWKALFQPKLKKK